MNYVVKFKEVRARELLIHLVKSKNFILISAGKNLKTPLFRGLFL